MSTEPFAYAIQAPIGSVVPLFHRRKDAEAYIDKLTDSRDEAKIIPLYRKTVNSERMLDIMADMPRWHTLTLDEQLRDGGSAMKCVPLFAVTAMRAAAEEIEKLRDAIRRLAEQDATLSVCDGNVTVTLDATLTDAEREAVRFCVTASLPETEKLGGVAGELCQMHAATLRGLLERLGGER